MRRKRLRPRGCLVIVLLFLAIAALIAIPKLRAPLEEGLFPLDYLDVVEEACARQGLEDPWLIMAMIREESDFDPAAGSPAGACGLMQLMPNTAAWIVEKAGFDYQPDQALWEPAANIACGVWYLHWLENTYYDKQGLTCAIAAYNAGHSTVDQWLAEGSWDGTLENISGIPYAETRQYVQYVYRSRDWYAKLYD